jgi:group I intron endonuclease
MPWAKHNIVKGVYVIINIINNKKYVGIGMGKKGIHDRLSCYEGLRCKQQIKLYRAIKKYGWSNFRLIVIRETTNVSKARKIEKHLIKVNKLQDDKYGYNISDGGEGNPGYKHTEATKLLMRQNNVKRTGYHHSEKTKRKISESHMGMKYGEEFRKNAKG